MQTSACFDSADTSLTPRDTALDFFPGARVPLASPNPEVRNGIRSPTLRPWAAGCASCPSHAQSERLRSNCAFSDPPSAADAEEPMGGRGPQGPVLSHAGRWSA